MSEQHTAEYMAGYWDGRMGNYEQMGTQDYILGYEMGKRIPNRPKLALPPPPQQSTSLEAQFKIPGTHPAYINGFRDGKRDATNIGLPKYPTKNRMYDDGYEIGFGSVYVKDISKDELDKSIMNAINIYVREVYTSFQDDELLLSPPPSSKGKSKTPKRNHSSLSPPPPPTHLSSQGKLQTLKRSHSSISHSSDQGKSKRRGGKSKKNKMKKSKTKKRNQKK
jgi:hypothetical protein